MNKDEIKAIFDKQASGYDKKTLRLAPIYESLYFLLESVFAELPSAARIICVGVATGKELIHLAKKFPEWRFTAVEPSGDMLDVCRQNVEEEGLTSRCDFHNGYLDSLPTTELYDGATCFLVSQFILEKEARVAFFREISSRLKPDGILANADLASDIGSEDFDTLLRVWQGVMSPADVSTEGLNRFKAAYANDVAVIPPDSVSSIIRNGGFKNPVQFFQAALIHAWFAKRI